MYLGRLARWTTAGGAVAAVALAGTAWAGGDGATPRVLYGGWGQSIQTRFYNGPHLPAGGGPCTHDDIDPARCQLPNQVGHGNDCPWDCADEGPDDRVATSDLLTLLGDWGGPSPCDFDGSGTVTTSDLLKLLGEWGNCGGIVGATSDDIAGFAVSDNIVVDAGGNINGICWWGFYLDFVASADCGTPTPPNDSFRITYYGNDDTGANDCPVGAPDTSNVLASFSAIAPTRAATGLVIPSGSGDLTEYEYSTSHTPVAVGAGECVWVEIVNEGTDVADCTWLWETASPGDDNSSQAGGPNNWDQALCISLAIGDLSNCNEPIFAGCEDAAGVCLINNGSPGCDVLCCCDLVCDFDSFCCDNTWDDGCANLALSSLEVCLADLAPCDSGTIASSANTGDDGNLTITLDVYGSWASTTFSGDGDSYNPTGAEAAAEAVFSDGFMVFFDSDGDGTNDSRTLLTCNSQWEGVNGTGEILKQVLSSVVTSDGDGDEVDDTADASFRILLPDPSILDLTVEINSVISSAGGDVRRLDQTYTFINANSNELVIDLTRIGDLDLLWIDNDFANDDVGTGWNAAGGDRYVFQREVGDDSTAVTMSSPDANCYTGSKGGIDPDGAGGPCAAYGFGTDTQEWNGFGYTNGDGSTACWCNDIAGVGTGVDGNSGATAVPVPPQDGACTPCDGKINLELADIAIEGLGSTSITIRHTYGQATP
jgi:hypothetical protein